MIDTLKLCEDVVNRERPLGEHLLEHVRPVMKVLLTCTDSVDTYVKVWRS